MSVNSPNVEDLFLDEHRFTDDVHGDILINPLERDCVDSPEFQRLFRISQLGFVDFVYQTANHTRGAHSLGVCAMAQRLIERLNRNNRVVARKRAAFLKGKGDELESQKLEALEKLTPLSKSETVLIRLGALLHDIPHGPYSHDIEQKNHVIKEREPGHDFRLKPVSRSKSHYGKYPKHDEWQHNPALFVSLMDTKNSVLARVIRWYSPDFWAVFKDDAGRYPHLKPFYDAVVSSGWENVAKEILPQLLFHLLVFEKIDDGENGTIRLTKSFDSLGHQDPIAWGIGPLEKPETWKKLHDAWYQPYRHDIIGNTLSADLLDYLIRDPQRLRLNRGLHLNLLNHYSLAQWQPADRTSSTLDENAAGTPSIPTWYRCSIDLFDYKRGTVRTEHFNDIFRLLDLRHEIHEKAVFHRIVQSANAMLARTILRLGNKRPHLKELFGFGTETTALCAEDFFLHTLIERSEVDDRTRQSGMSVRSIAVKLAERRVYRPLMVIPGDRAVRMLPSGAASHRIDREITLRKLAAIVDSTYFAPFFLFISACVEKLLEHVFADEGAVMNYLERVAADATCLAEAMEIIPKGVIIWTSPYKQLYKNPGLLVSTSANGKASQIDELLSEEHTSFAEVKERVKEAIEDAESKYASLWKLYVFLSDGLFYTGVYAKLVDHQCSGDPHENPSEHAHKTCLEGAERLLITAFDRAYDWWNTFKDQIDLGKTIDADRFKSLLKKYVAHHDPKAKWGAEFHKGVSAVSIEHYLHGEDTHRCRDARYKFDVEATEDWVSGDVECQKVADMLAMLNRPITGFKVEELNELLLRFRASGIQKWSPETDVKLLWGAGIPWPKGPSIAAVPAPIEEIPQTFKEIEEWLIAESRWLQPHVGRQLTEDLRPLVSYIESLSVELRPKVFADLRLRISNESRLIWNNIKTDQILTILRKKWTRDGDTSDALQDE